MTAPANPALEKFAAQIADELLLAQVLIKRVGREYELRHETDRSATRASLRLVVVSDLRKLVEVTARGAFRPLKSAPNLQSGWRCVAANNSELECVLNHLYPGAVADWFAGMAQTPPVTNYREFTERQTGMYRITTLLTDGQAAQAIRACCHRRFCLKRRLWTVAGLALDSPQEKSLIPCLEPCAILLEFARKAARIEQEEEPANNPSPSDLEAMQAALETALEKASGTEREADFNSPDNPRRLQLALEKLRASKSKGT